jgi:hypothetical protein
VPSAYRAEKEVTPGDLEPRDRNAQRIEYKEIEEEEEKHEEIGNGNSDEGLPAYLS